MVHGAPSSGAMYPTLMEMEDQNLIHEVSHDSKPFSERGRKAYRITEKGEESLKKWEEQRQTLLSKTAGWRQMWRSFWNMTPEEALVELKESLERLEFQSGEMKTFSKERIESLKKDFEEVSKRLKLLSKNIQS